MARRNNIKTNGRCPNRVLGNAPDLPLVHHELRRAGGSSARGYDRDRHGPCRDSRWHSGARAWILSSDCGSECGSWQSSPTGKNEVLQRARRGTGPTLARGLGSTAFGNFQQRCQSGRRNSRSQASSSHASANSRSRDKLLVFMGLERTVTQHERASPALTDPVLVWSFPPGLSAPPYAYVCLSPCPGPFWSV
jgi:hypothetical protein